MPKKAGKDEKKFKKDKGNESGSSNPKSSTTSADDERKPLLKGHDSRSTDRRETRSTTKSIGDQKTGLRKRSSLSLGASTSRDTPQPGHLSEKDLSFDPESHASPSKRHRLLPKVFRSKKKSPSPSSDTKCSCEDKLNHQPECPERKDADCKSTSATTQKLLKSASSRTTKKNEDCTQSSGSSDPSAADYFSTETEKSRLVVPDQSGEVHHTSPSKLKSNLKNRLSNLTLGNASSDSDSSRKDIKSQQQRRRKTDLKGKLPIKNPFKSEASSSSASPISKKNSDTSESSLPIHSKSSSSDPNVVESCPANKSSNKSERKTRSSSVPMDCDPPEGGSGIPFVSPESREQLSGEVRNPRIEQRSVNQNRPAPESRSRSRRHVVDKCTCNTKTYEHKSGCSFWASNTRNKNQNKGISPRPCVNKSERKTKSSSAPTDYDLLKGRSRMHLVPSASGEHHSGGEDRNPKRENQNRPAPESRSRSRRHVVDICTCNTKNKYEHKMGCSLRASASRSANQNKGISPRPSLNKSKRKTTFPSPRTDYDPSEGESGTHLVPSASREHHSGGEGRNPRIEQRSENRNRLAPESRSRSRRRPSPDECTCNTTTYSHGSGCSYRASNSPNTNQHRGLSPKPPPKKRDSSDNSSGERKK